MRMNWLNGSGIVLLCMQTTLIIGRNAKNALSLNFWTRCIHQLKLKNKLRATAESCKFNGNINCLNLKLKSKTCSKGLIYNGIHMKNLWAIWVIHTGRVSHDISSFCSELSSSDRIMMYSGKVILAKFKNEPLKLLVLYSLVTVPLYRNNWVMNTQYSFKSKAYIGETQEGWDFGLSGGPH